MDEMYELWGELTRAAREELGLGQVEVARRARLSQATVSRIERGKGCPSDEAKYRLAVVLQKSPKHLFPYLPVSAEFVATMDRELVA